MLWFTHCNALLTAGEEVLLNQHIQMLAMCGPTAVMAILTQATWRPLMGEPLMIMGVVLYTYAYASMCMLQGHLQLSGWASAACITAA